jgi:predicted glutamine amidotransferase
MRALRPGTMLRISVLVPLPPRPSHRNHSMARMFGLIGNRSDLAGRLLRASSSSLQARPAPGSPVGWGVGFFQTGEVLLQRRPSDSRRVVDLTEGLIDVRTDALIAHVRMPHVGSLRTENTQPFRYRSWLFAQTGTVNGFARLGERLLASQPDFLRRNVRGETDAELCFYLFLSFLHDSGQLDAPRVDPNRAAEALRSSAALVDRLSAEEGYEANTGDVMVCNGEHLLALHRSGEMAYQEVVGRRGVEELIGADSRDPPITNAEQTRYTLIASGIGTAPSGWTMVHNRVIVSLTREAPPRTETL